MTNQSSDGEFGSITEIMKANSKERVDDYGWRSEMETGVANQPTYHQYLENEASLLLFPALESIAHSPDQMGLSPSPTDDKILHYSLMCSVY